MNWHPTHTQALIGLLSFIIVGLLLIWWSCERPLGPKPQPKEDLLANSAPNADPVKAEFESGEHTTLYTKPTPRLEPLAQKDLDQALNKCRETVGPLPCYSKPYLKARHDYHKLLVKHGMLDPKSAELDRERIKQSIESGLSGVDLKTTKRPTSTPSRTAKQKKRDKHGRFTK